MKRYHAVAIAAIAVVIAGLAGCTDATQSQIAGYGSPHQVTCYNYSTVIYDGVSTGRVKDETDSIAFEDGATRKLVEIRLGQSTSCVIRVH